MSGTYLGCFPFSWETPLGTGDPVTLDLSFKRD